MIDCDLKQTSFEFCTIADFAASRKDLKVDFGPIVKLERTLRVMCNQEQMFWKPLSVQSQEGKLVVQRCERVLRGRGATIQGCSSPSDLTQHVEFLFKPAGRSNRLECGALPVCDHAVRNEDAVQVSAVVCRVAEQVQTVSGPVVPELGEPTPEPLLRCTFLEKSHNFTVRTHQIEQKPSLPRAQSCPKAQRSKEQLSDPAIVSTQPAFYHDAAAPPARLDGYSLHFGTRRTGRGRGGATRRT